MRSYGSYAFAHLTAASSSSKNYILRSKLDLGLIEQAAQADAELRHTVNEDDDEDDEWKNRADGSIIAWQTSDQLSMAGVLHVILALVLINGRILPDGEGHVLSFSAYKKLMGDQYSPAKIVLEGSASSDVDAAPGHTTIYIQDGHT